MIRFVYHPKSGDRLVALSQHGLVSVLWSNGSRHIVGDLLEMSFYTAAPKHHWREAARRLCRELSELVSGFAAWDSGGTIKVLCPPDRAEEVFKTFVSVRPFRQGDEDDRNRAAAFRAEAAKLVRDRDGDLCFCFLKREPKTLSAPEVQEPVSHYPNWVVKVGEELVVAPENWGRPTLERAPTQPPASDTK